MRIHRALSFVLAAILIGVGLLKFGEGQAKSLLPHQVEIAIGLAEIVCGVLLIFHRTTIACSFTVLLAIGGCIIVLFAPPGTSCGCLGKNMAVNSHLHTMLAATLGSVACLVMLTRRTPNQMAGTADR